MIDLKTIQIDEIDFAAQGNAILGIRDSGKTYTATWMAERLLDAHIPFIAFDPIGVWRYLRIGREDKPGYPVVVVGDDGDLPLAPDSVLDIVRAAMQQNIPLIIDLYSISLSKAAWRKIVEESVRLLTYENKKFGLRHIFIEEAAEFVPQRVGPQQGSVYAEIEKLARMGRNASLGYTLINQRAEEVNKAVLELCDCLILHRQKGRHSLTALDKWMSIADTQNTAQVIKSLPTLEQGKCWIWQAGSSLPALVNIPQKNTVHPNPKDRDVANYSISADVSKFVDQLLTVLKSRTPAKKVEKGKTVTLQDDLADELSSQKQKNEELNRKLSDSIDRERQLQKKLEAVRRLLEPQYNELKKIFGEIEIMAPSANGASTDVQWEIWIEKLQGKQRDMLSVVIARKRITKIQLGLLIGMSHNGGSFNTYLSKLVSLGLVKREGNEIVLQE